MLLLHSVKLKGVFKKGKTGIKGVLQVICGSINCNDCMVGNNRQVAAPSRGLPNQLIEPVTSIYYILTESCNMSCRYCFVQQKPHHMSLETAMDTTKWLIAQAEAVGKIPTTNFFGGEPLLMWDEIIVPVTEYVRNVYGKPFRLGMTTNGVLLDKEKLDFMKANDIGCLFSIDGPKDIQDRNRPLKSGGSSYDVVAPKIPMILDYYPNMTFRSTIDHDDKDVMVRIHKFAVENGYNNIFCIPNNLSTWSNDEVDNLKKQLHDLTDYWMDLFREGKVVDFNPLGRAFYDIMRINHNISHNIHRPPRQKCGVGGTGFVSIDWEGGIYTCQEMVGNAEHSEKFYVGSIYDGVNENKRLELLKSFNAQNVRSEKDNRCNDCLLNPICDGSCVMNNVIKTGSRHILPEISCIYYETAVKEMKRMLDTMAAEENTTFRTYFLKKSRFSGR